jgi:hypothetical protein
MYSILIPSSVYGSTVKRLSRLAAKAGIDVTAVTGETTIYRMARVWIRPIDQEPYPVLRLDRSQALACKRLTIGAMPVVSGFAFIGKVSHLDGGNILAMAPGCEESDLPIDWRNAKASHCDHCGKVRQRAETFLIRSPEGALMRVGRQCLADFVVNADALIAMAEFQDSLRIPAEQDPDYEGSGWGQWGTSTFHYLAACVACTESSGFVKMQDTAGRKPTAYAASFACHPRPTTNSHGERDEWDSLQPTDDHYATAVGIAAWLETESGSSNYMHNLQVAAQCACVERQTMGLLASAPAAYARAMGQIAEKKAAASRPDAGHYGAIKVRSEVEVTITRIHTYATDYGMKTIVAMRTDEGKDLVTFTTSSSAPNVDAIGKRYAVKGTVKKHENYKGRAQTELSRVVFTALALACN